MSMAIHSRAQGPESIHPTGSHLPGGLERGTPWVPTLVLPRVFSCAAQVTPGFT